MIISRYIRDAEIEESTMRILHRYAQQRGPIVSPPVPIEQIVEHTIDIPIIWDSIPDRGGTQVLAKIEARGQPRPEITLVMNVDKALFFKQYEGTEQFSQAHELGHYALHIDHAKLNTLLLPEATEQSLLLCRSKMNKQSDVTGWQREWQAERFAAYLLMPKDLVLNACKGLDLCRWQNLYHLKDQFHVTITALTRRLTELQLIIIADDRTIQPYLDSRASQPDSLWG
jgi:hypothetical protein